MDGKCDGAPRNCEILRVLGEHHARRCAEEKIIGADAITSAMAVGLVIEVWRNSPVESMHASRRGPSDAAMFAESTALHEKAIKVLTAENVVYALFDFEEHLLDRTRPWAGTGGRTLRDLGYGFLGQYAKHVKERTNALASLIDHTCVQNPLEVYLVNKALMFGRAHKGMPRWPIVVERIGTLLADPNHAAWYEDGHGARALAEMPQQTPPIDQLTATLLTSPFTLPDEVLEWLSCHLLFCAGPPYSPVWEEHHSEEQGQ